MPLEQFPIHIGFNKSTPPVGYISLDTDKLPPTPDWHIAIGYMADTVYSHEYVLKEFGLISDEKFRAYDSRG